MHSTVLNLADKFSDRLLVLLNDLLGLVAVLCWSNRRYHCSTHKIHDKCTDSVDEHITSSTKSNTHRVLL